MRLAVDMTPPEPTPDDLVALAEAVRRAAARPPAEPEPEPVRKPARAARAEDPAFLSTASRRRHLRALPDATDDDASTEAGDDGR